MCKQTCTAETECTKLMNGALLSFLLTCRGKDRYRPGLYHRPDQACVMLVCRFQVACGSWLSRFGLCPLGFSEAATAILALQNLRRQKIAFQLDDTIRVCGQLLDSGYDPFRQVYGGFDLHCFKHLRRFFCIVSLTACQLDLRKSWPFPPSPRWVFLLP